MTLHGVNSVGAGDQQPQPSKKGGLNELAKALGVSPDALKRMSKEEVEKLAQQKGVDLEQYEKPKPPQGQDPMSMNGSLFGVRNNLG